MNYFEYPQKGTGQVSYLWNGQPMSLDFSSLQFDWQNMADIYNSNSTAAQKTAVATLMKACGYAVNSEYGTTATSNLNEGLLEIGDQAFYMFLKNVKSLTLPSTVETLGERAFSGCNISGEFIINKNLKTIGGGAFAGNSITGFYINENGNDYFTSKDGVLYTKDGQSLVVFPPALVGEELTIPDGTVKIAPYALSNSTKVKKINLPESLKEIGNFAFRSCNLQDITLGKNLTTLGYGVFQGNASFNAINLDAANTAFTVSNGMLVHKASKTLVAVTANTKELSVPAGVETIAPYLLYANKNITKLDAPQSTKTVGEYAFYICPSLAQVQIPGAVTLESSSFWHAVKLQSINFPSSLRTIGPYSFCGSGLKEAIIPEGVDSIGGAAFQRCPLKNINVPNTVVEIDDFGFSLTNATYIKCGKDLKRLGNLAFQDNKRAATIELNEGLQEIGFKALYSEQLISDFVIPASVTTIGDSALIMTPLRKLTNRSSVPQAIATSIIGMPVKLDWNPTPHELYNSCELCVPESALEAYKAAPVWRQFKKITGFAGVNNIDDENAEIVKIYSIEGYRRDRLMPGINICRYSNGKTRKVFSR